MPHAAYEWMVFALCAALWALACPLCARRGLGWRTGALLGALSLALCMVCARAYAILVGELPGLGYFGPFFSDMPYDYAFGGGVLGFLLAVTLTAALARKPLAEVCDAAAPLGLLAAALLRLAEGLSDFGWGDLVDAAWMRRYPFAIPNRYGEWCAAVFNLEALCALGVLAAVVLAGPRLRGRRLAAGLCGWALTQIFCESLRIESIQWGFVRVQQVQGAVLVAVVMLAATLRLPNKRAAVPSWLTFVCGVGAVILLEFALDKLPWPVWLDYALMAAALAAMGWAAVRLVLGGPSEARARGRFALV